MKEKVEVSVDGNIELREIDYISRRGKDEYISYPKLKPYEHIYEDRAGLKVFTSTVR